MATKKNITVNGVLTPVWQTDATAQQIDDAVTAAQNAVRYDAAQTLTDDQKTQARTNINAAPGGFGLGANGYPYPYTVLTGDTIDTINRSGLYAYDDDNVSIDAGLNPYGKNGLLLHLAHTIVHSLDAKQIFYSRAPKGNAYLSRVKDTDKGWQPWEWVNPPMTLGVEFRTTERYLGKPVYVQLVNFGALGNATTKSVDVAIENVDKIPVLGGTALEVPLIPGSYNGAISGISATRTSAKITIAITTTTDLSWMQAEVLLGYTKTTD